MSTLLMADIHQTPNAREEERWGLFDWAREYCLKNDCNEVLLLGDGTDAKDKHPASVVNRMVHALEMFDGACINFTWLAGNHDYVERTNPFFGFTDFMRPRIRFISQPARMDLSIGKCILLPSTPTWEEDWKGIDFSEYDYAFAHQTFSGAVSETGFRLVDGLPPTALDGVKVRAYSGDIHVPQKFGKKGEYVGAPYRTRYGDSFEGRCLLIENVKGKHKQTDLHYPTKGKHLVTVGSVDRLEAFKGVPEGGSVKIRMQVNKADLALWPQTKELVKAEAQRLGWNVHDIELVRTEAGGAAKGAVPIRAKTVSPTKIYNDYCHDKRAPAEAVEMGRRIIGKMGARA